MTDVSRRRAFARVRDRFLKLLRQGRSVRAAADAAGVPRSSLYKWRETRPEFAAAWRRCRAGGRLLPARRRRRRHRPNGSKSRARAGGISRPSVARQVVRKVVHEMVHGGRSRQNTHSESRARESVARAAAFPPSNQGLGRQIRTPIANKQHPFRRGSKWSTSSLVPGPRTPDITPPRGRCGRSSRQPGQIRKEAAVTNSLRVMPVSHLFPRARRRGDGTPRRDDRRDLRGHGV